MTTDSAKRKNAEAVRRWRTKNPEACRAHVDVRNAKRRGELEVPEFCSVTGCDSKATHAHHEDYSRPLDVIWLCRWHHEAIHHDTPAAVPAPLFAAARSTRRMPK